MRKKKLHRLTGNEIGRFSGPEKGRFILMFGVCVCTAGLNCTRDLFGAGVLGYGLSAFADGVLGQFTGQQETDGGLDFPTGDRRPLVVVSQTAGFGGDALENVVDETVHDAHGLRGDPGVGMYLFQHLVDVDGVRFLPLWLAFLVGLGDVFLRLAGLLHCLTGRFASWSHFDSIGVRR